ncbi:hypothetical protein BJF88_04800 [Cellulosimicrobium sp. CUA-896]|nr:hypothetical protein BJF88_04800 [Cellulosimicrobium sp. CUA-896]
MVTTTSDACTASGVSTFGCWPVRSIPTSRMASTATGLMRSPGIDPADRTSTEPPPSSRRNPAAICDRPALCTHTNSTLGRYPAVVVMRTILTHDRDARRYVASPAAPAAACSSTVARPTSTSR